MTGPLTTSHGPPATAIVANLRSMPPDIVTALKTANAVHKLMDSLFNPTHSFKELRDEEFRQWLVELHCRFNEQVQRLDERAAAHDKDMATKLTALLEERQFHRVLANVAFEASREAMDERRRMLAFAAAGALNVDLSVAEIARVERIIRELDPDDVRLLGKLRGLTADELDGILESDPVSYAALVAAHCSPPVNPGAVIVVASGHISEPAVTSLGALVLRVMQAYLHACEPS